MSRGFMKPVEQIVWARTNSPGFTHPYLEEKSHTASTATDGQNGQLCRLLCVVWFALGYVEFVCILPSLFVNMIESNGQANISSIHQMNAGLF